MFSFFPCPVIIVIIKSVCLLGVSDEEDQKPVRLPLKVAVELQPRSNYSWARVQSLAHNPRLRSDMHVCVCISKLYIDKITLLEGF